MRKVLPKAPGTIAAVASLLADSRFLDEKEGIIPSRAEFMSAAEWEGEGIWRPFGGIVETIMGNRAHKPFNRV